jgi:hypothetical protein
VLVFGMLVGFGALFLRLNSIAFGEARDQAKRRRRLTYRCSRISDSC